MGFFFGENMKLLVSASSRSGTVFVTKFLNELNLLTAHENHMQPKKNPDRRKNICLAGFTFIFENPIQYEHIFHQVREPIKSICSITTHPPGVFDRVEKHFGLTHLDSNCDMCRKKHPKDGCRVWHGKDFVCKNQMFRAARYWFYLNQQAEKISEWRYKIEEIQAPSIFQEFCDRLELGKKECPPLTIPNSRKGNYIEFTYEDIIETDPVLGKKIKEKAQQYGY